MFDFGGGDGVVDEAEETVGFGGVDQFFCDFVDSVVEVVEADLWDGSISIFGWCHVDGMRVDKMREGMVRFERLDEVVRIEVVGGSEECLVICRQRPEGR